MAKPTPKRIGLLRYVRDHQNGDVPAYTAMWTASWSLLCRYYLSDEDSRIVQSAEKAGLIRFSRGDSSFSFLTDKGKDFLEKHATLYPEIPHPHRGRTPRLNATTDGRADHDR